jgi:hypothetical protein
VVFAKDGSCCNSGDALDAIAPQGVEDCGKFEQVVDDVLLLPVVGPADGRGLAGGIANVGIGAQLEEELDHLEVASDCRAVMGFISVRVLFFFILHVRE